jgi:hypothetical protein
MTVDRRQAAWLVGACALLALGIWANTGTLAPYGATLEHPFLWQPCDYALNIDHFHFKATFLMLDGAPREQWEFSVVLRRILYPLLGYPLMKALGFGGGGLVLNVLLAWVGVLWFWRALAMRLAEPPPRAALMLLATYPGFVYWAGLPYLYACIVPFSLICLAMLWRLEEVESWREAMAPALIMGVLFTGYDLLPFFGLGALLLLARRRQWKAAAAAAFVMAAPTAIVVWLLRVIWHVPVVNANSASYIAIVASYFRPIDVPRWMALLREVPKSFFDAFLFSNFLFLPLLSVVALLASRRDAGGRRLLGTAERCMLVAVLLVFLLTNLAPPYPGWPLRGSWVARLYQPIIGVLLVAVATALLRHREPSPARAALHTAAALALCGQLWTVFAPVLGSGWLSGELYWRFYRHAPRPFYELNLEKLGRRPVGSCATANSDASVTH